MAAISAMVAVASLAVTAGGAYMSYSAAKEHAAAQQAQLAADREHAGLVNESNLAVRADNQKAIEAQREVEKISQTQMNLDATRRQREIIRSTQQTLSASHAVATAAGATAPGSSAMGGVIGGISGREGVNLLGVTQNQEAGNAIFGQHQVMYDAYRQASIDGYVPAATQVGDNSGTMAAAGAGVSAVGGMLSKGQGTIDKLGSYFGSSTPAVGAGNNYGYSADTYGNGYT